MGTPTKRIVISGYYGYGNSGDEAVLQSILSALAQVSDRELTIEPVVLSADPDWTCKTYGVQAVHRMRLGEIWRTLGRSDGLISGGGSLLQDATSTRTIPYYIAMIKLAQWLRKPTFIYAQGIGPVHRRMFYPLIRNAFKKSAYVSVRDHESASLLAQMGVIADRIDIVPDPVMGMKPLDADSAGSEGSLTSEWPVVGISVRHWNKDHSELKAVAEALNELSSRRKVHLRFLPFHHPHDLEASLDVLRYMGIEWTDDADLKQKLEALGISMVYQEHPQAMQSLVAECDVLVGMRLHSLIYAASQYVPVVGIAYDPKINHYLRRLDMEPAMSTDRIDAAGLTAAIAGALEEKESWIKDRSTKIEEMIQKSLFPAQQIRNHLRIKG